MNQQGRRSLFFVFIVIISGAAAGSALSSFLGFALPAGVVKDFFLMSKPLGWDPFTFNLQIITFTLGFTIDISVTSLIGMAMAWYFLRYFR